MPENDAELTTLQEAVRRLTAENDGLRLGMQSRAVIEQAKGVLMAREGLDADAAFARLRKAARDGNRRLLDVAADELGRLGAGRVRVATAAPAAAATTAARAAGPVVAMAMASLAQPEVRATVPDSGPGADDGPGSGAEGPMPGLPRSAPRDRSLVLLRAAAEAAEDASGVLTALARGLRRPAPAGRATFLTVTSDGAMRLVASYGMPTGTLARWRNIPLSVDFPATACARSAAPVFEDDPDAAVLRWPVLDGSRSVLGTFCCLPVLVHGALVGVVGLGWPEGTPLTGADRRMLRAAVTAVSDLLVDRLESAGVHSLLPGAAADDDARTTAGVVLDAVFAESVLLLPLHGTAAGVATDPVTDEREADDEAEVVDLLLAWGNAPARAAAERTARRPGAPFGRRVSEAAPHVVGTDLWRALLAGVGSPGAADVLRTTAWFWEPVTDGAPAVPVKLGAVWNGVLASRLPPQEWQPLT